MQTADPDRALSTMDVVIVDDEPAARRALRECCERETDLRVAGEYGDSRSALEALQARPPDLLFLDVEIDAMSGIDLARALDPATLPQIVFVTAYDHYALDAFEVSAADYLLKPFDDDRFRASLARVRRRHAQQDVAQHRRALAALLERLQAVEHAPAPDRARIIVEFRGQMRVIDTCDVEVVEADRNYVVLTVGREACTTRGTLQQAESSLRSQPFMRISRSCLVNMNHVRQVDRTPRGDLILVLAGGRTVTSSESYREPLREYLNRMRIGLEG
ncbi:MULTISPECIES: LytTR family DNA-binding domain-containing protein [unclassified Lysobacter]|uniref:LytR/AlgR family response regulator transcription factor n=1 Tax=unclassified Lysobacter TaxID=2635362 RepID=UPI0006F2CA2D|nr:MULTISPECIES: LytTR family DNA-binding domain-containing protein [unclassified Lysobacter]KQZ67778.1 hypothetical protein ASD53_00130 [Lysobacter sp. Root559]KRA80871.1 hypothetical protein ASD78_18505 [Lysobacter sp. Root667]KRC38105.1 hypothetical protein ASE10_00485 [Lysobacter sp. Root76]KRD69430.1 hypothetical protein ASE45_09775 [Lysobacter sp. Root96]